MASVFVGALVGAGAFLGTASMASAAQVTVSVPGNTNPYLAGQPGGTSCCSGDTTENAAPKLALTGFAAGSVITFSAEGGFDYSGGTAATSADGTPGAANLTPSIYGISGAQGVQYNGLVGVFLDDSYNSDSGALAPAQRNDGVSFTSIAPELYQIFWIGDGLTGTGTGTVQQFVAPTGATRLFLGSTDGGGWYNNSGVSAVTINYTPAVPEASVWAMMIAGLGVIGVAMRRRRGEALATA